MRLRLLLFVLQAAVKERLAEKKMQTQKRREAAALASDGPQGALARFAKR